MPAHDDPLAPLRGALPARSPGARGVERLARNPDCARLAALTVAGTTPDLAAQVIYGEPAAGQSPFALAVGTRFEERLFDDGAAELVRLYAAAGRLPETARALDVAKAHPRTDAASLQERAWLSLRLLAAHVAGDPAAPALILHPRLAIDLAGVACGLEPDAVVVADGRFRPVEVKSYPDRGGRTDPADVRSASRQAAVGLVALRTALARIGVADVGAAAPAIGDLVLRKPGTMSATLRPLTLSGEVASLEAALDRAEGIRARLEAEGAPLDTAAGLERWESAWRDGCREHCALNPVCKRAAVARGELGLLGGVAREALAPAGDLFRVAALLDGAAPAGPEETRLAEALRAAVAALDEATRHVA